MKRWLPQIALLGAWTCHPSDDREYEGCTLILTWGRWQLEMMFGSEVRR